MNQIRIIMTTLLAGAALLAVGAAWAQPHLDPAPQFTTVTPVTDPVEIAGWLRQLAGRYKYDGMIQLGDCTSPTGCTGVKGKSDCIAIGTGPGVQCILNVTWQDLRQVNFQTGAVSDSLMALPYMDPAMELYGLDPGIAAINRLQVDNKGLPEGGLGSIVGDRATFKSPCVNNPAGCYRIVRIEAKPDANILYMWIDIEHVPDPPTNVAVIAMHRVPVEEAEKAAEKKPQ